MCVATVYQTTYKTKTTYMLDLKHTREETNTNNKLCFYSTYSYVAYICVIQSTWEQWHTIFSCQLSTSCVGFDKLYQSHLLQIPEIMLINHCVKYIVHVVLTTMYIHMKIHKYTHTSHLTHLLRTSTTWDTSNDYLKVSRSMWYILMLNISNSHHQIIRDS